MEITLVLPEGYRPEKKVKSTPGASVFPIYQDRIAHWISHEHLARNVREYFHLLDL
jgi:hypothetical protein